MGFYGLISIFLALAIIALVVMVWTYRMDASPSVKELLFWITSAVFIACILVILALFEFRGGPWIKAPEIVAQWPPVSSHV